MKKTIPKGQPVEGDMSAALDSRFLNSIVLQGAMDSTKKPYITATIDRVEFHDVLKYENGASDKDCYLIHFSNSDKPLKLAKTNIKRLINLHGSIGKGWHGKKVAIGIESDRRPDLGGNHGPCVRILMVDPDTGKPPVVEPINPFAK